MDPIWGELGTRQGLGIRAHGFERLCRTWACNWLQWKTLGMRLNVCSDTDRQVKRRKWGAVRTWAVGARSWVGSRLMWRDLQKANHRLTQSKGFWGLRGMQNRGKSRTDYPKRVLTSMIKRERKAGLYRTDNSEGQLINWRADVTGTGWSR